MIFTPAQDAVLMAVKEWLADEEGPQVFRLFGFAGTGKTTLAKHFGTGVEGLVLYGAYTGKAAYVLRQMGCPEASTIHSMIYHPAEKSRQKLRDLENGLVELRQELRAEAGGLALEDDTTLLDRIEDHKRIVAIKKLIEKERENLARPMFALNTDSAVQHAKLVIIDEVSMVDGRMGEDLLSFGTKVLVLGDPAQLPPVAAAGFFTEGVEPNIMMTDIHRQAGGNPIIAMATATRNKEFLECGNYGQSLVVDAVTWGADAAREAAQAADQILVGRNKTRHASNRRMRSLLGFDHRFPLAGDRLVCLRNNHDVGLLNGAIFNVEEPGTVEDDVVFMSVTPENGGESLDVQAHAFRFDGSEEPNYWERGKAEDFDYGYALTVHKAQGSQWDEVLLFDESGCFRDERWRWLYTGITRAAERITIVRM